MASTFYEQGKEALRLLKELLFPRACCHCGKRLMVDEEVLCSTCMQKLPFTHLKGEKNNIVERLLWDHLITTERGNSLLYYSKKISTRFITLSNTINVLMSPYSLVS